MDLKEYNESLSKKATRVFLDSMEKRNVNLFKVDKVVVVFDTRFFTLKEIVIKTYEDHRMAMAFAPAVIQFGSMIIDEPDVVSKSYPSFWQEFQKVLPCKIDIID